MRKIIIRRNAMRGFLKLVALVFLTGLASQNSWSREITYLRDNWRVQSEKEIQEIKEGGAKLSGPGVNLKVWYPASVPATVLAVLVENKVYPDPYYGVNLTKIPGYVSGRWLAMPEDSPFYPSWWYRTEFAVPESYQGKNLILHLDGINYKANVWLNGKKIGDEKDVIGMFRRFEFDITDLVKFRELNYLAIETIAPGKLPQKRYITKQLEATTGWDDHNPYPPDANVGIWQDVYITATGAIAIKNPYVQTKLEIPQLNEAHLTISADLVNRTDKEVSGELTGTIENINFKQAVKLAPREVKTVWFKPEQFKQLNIKNPRVWWPSPVGPQELYDLKMEVRVDGKISDDEKVTFGIREITSYINDEGWRTFKVNGKNILIRGGAWMTSDMLLRLTPKRYEALVRYAKEAGFNMLRSEGFSIRETEEFYSLCDKYGIMVTQQIFGRNIPDEKLAVSCVEDMILRIRNHPSLVHFLGHDETFPTQTLDAAYRELIAKYIPDRTYQPHSGAFNVKDRFETGGTRTGTLELWTYAGPAHYYTHKKDGAWGFAQSGGIGGVIADKESIKRMLPDDQLWPQWSEAFSLHTVIQGAEYFNYLRKAIYRRYGEPKNFDDFWWIITANNYESARGMFEAYARNKYSATGITTWKYDASWPAALTWQYVDWYLLPTGAYFGAKKACEPLHIQYSYDDNSIYIVNSYYREFKGLKADVKIYNYDLTEKFSKTEIADVAPDGKTELFKMTMPQGLSKSFFLALKLYDGDGKLVTDNFYWLSTTPEKPARRYFGAVALSKGSFFDHSDLRKLPPVKLSLSCQNKNSGSDQAILVSVKNPTNHLAFFIKMELLKGKDGLQVAPSYWSDNYFSLLPGEEKLVLVSFAQSDLETKEPVIKVGGWNIEPVDCAPGR